MKIAVLSDIHGNLPALQAVARDIEAWQPDETIVNGDIVNRGPCSGAVLGFVLQKRDTAGWHLLRGNHEDYILRCAQPGFATEGVAFQVNQFAYFAYDQVNGHVNLLAELPEQYTWIAPDGSEFRVVHASMGNNREGIYERLSDVELRARIDPPPAVFVTGHTHHPLRRVIDGTLVVNTGSVGAPFDLDWRPSYGRFTWHAGDGWSAEVVRVSYDRRLTEQDYVRSGFLQEGGPLAQLMLIELRKARGLIYRWASRYEQAVIAGQISLEDSVKAILREEDNRPLLGPPGWVI